MKHYLRIMGFIFVLVPLFGCATATQSLQDVDLIETGYASADRLYHNLSTWSKVKETRDATILYTSLANIDHLDQSSRFGRMLSEHIASRLSQRNLRIAEVRMRTAFSITPSGEFMLSRDIRKIEHKQDATTVLVGTYAVGITTVLVNLKLIDIDSGEVISTDDFSVPVGANTRSLIDPSSGDDHHIISEDRGADVRTIYSRAIDYCKEKGLYPVLSGVNFTVGGADGTFTCEAR